jgi:hypothetical protein
MTLIQLLKNNYLKKNVNIVHTPSKMFLIILFCLSEYQICIITLPLKNESIKFQQFSF